MLKQGDKIMVGSDSSGKCYVELTEAQGSVMNDWRIKITSESPTKKANSVELSVDMLDAIYDRVHQKELRRPHEEE
jgi:hypothetical protein